MKLRWGAPSIVTAEVALVFEWGASSRLALMGQLHAAFPPKIEKKLIELNIDAVGIWISDRGDFSLDATLYDSHIAFAQLSGDARCGCTAARLVLPLLRGGYHPEFNAPAGFPKLERMKIELPTRTTSG